MNNLSSIGIEFKRRKIIVILLVMMSLFALAASYFIASDWQLRGFEKNLILVMIVSSFSLTAKNNALDLTLSSVPKIQKTAIDRCLVFFIYYVLGVSFAYIIASAFFPDVAVLRTATMILGLSLLATMAQSLEAMTNPRSNNPFIKMVSMIFAIMLSFAFGYSGRFIHGLLGLGIVALIALPIIFYDIRRYREPALKN